jgi:hypothetical protein
VQFVYESGLITRDHPVLALSGVNLSGADLREASVTQGQLDQVKSLEGATTPNGQKYEDWLKSKGRGEKGSPS